MKTILIINKHPQSINSYLQAV